MPFSDQRQFFLYFLLLPLGLGLISCDRAEAGKRDGDGSTSIHKNPYLLKKPLITSDSLLKMGSSASVSYRAPGTDARTVVITSPADSNKYLWQLIVSPWNIKTGMGMITMNYSGNGSITTKVHLNDLNEEAVNGYPFIFYGGDQWGDRIDGQAPQFPAQLSAMNSLVVDTSYSLSGTFGGDIDVLYDEWLIPSKTYTGGSGGALEVEVLPYIKFSEFGSFNRIGRFREALTRDGSQTLMDFDEFSSGRGPGNAVLFVPVSGVISGEVRLDLLRFVKEGARTAGLDSSWWLSGIELGTEFGDGPVEDFVFTVSKFDIEQVFYANVSPVLLER